MHVIWTIYNKAIINRTNVTRANIIRANVISTIYNRTNVKKPML